MRGRSCRGSRVAPFVTRSRRRISTHSSPSSMRAGTAVDSKQVWSSRCAKFSSAPDFLFRLERDPTDFPPASPYELSDVELASRLSFFLWSTIPDEELLALAVAGELSDPTVLDRQVARMLADPRADALVHNFAGQWLYLRNMQQVGPDPVTFPEFDDNLGNAFARETDMFLVSPAARGPKRAGAAGRRLYVHERATGQALRRPGSLWQPLPPSTPAGHDPQGTARARQHPHRHVIRQPYVAGPAREVAAREPARSTAPAPAAKRSRLCGNSTRRAFRRVPYASGWSSTARIPSAHRVMRRWIPWASRWRISTPSAGGGPPAKAAR